MVHTEPFLSIGSTGYGTLWPIVFAWLLTLAAVYKLLVYPVLISPLARVPNAHWSASISSAWILWIRFTNCENRETHGAHLEKGPVVRLGPNEISVNCVDGGIRSVYGSGFEKGDWYSIFDNYGYVTSFALGHFISNLVVSFIKLSRCFDHFSQPVDSRFPPTSYYINCQY